MQLLQSPSLSLSFYYCLYSLNRLYKVFAEIDSCGDGRVGFEEFEMGMFMLGLDLSAEEAKAHFAEMDGDGSGVVRFEELCVHAAEMRELLKKEVALTGSAGVGRTKMVSRMLSPQAKEAAKPVVWERTRWSQWCAETLHRDAVRCSSGET